MPCEFCAPTPGSRSGPEDRGTGGRDWNSATRRSWLHFCSIRVFQRSRGAYKRIILTSDSPITNGNNPVPWDARTRRRLKLRELDILMAVVQMGGMRKAADHLHMSQPAISKAIADLEHTLGVSLLDRGPQGIEPTQYGRALLKRSVAVFDELKQSVQDIDFLADPEAGELRIGSSSAQAEGIVLAVIDRLSRRYPRVVFHVVRGGTLAQYDDLRERRVELGVVRLFGTTTPDDMEEEVLFEEPMVVVAGAENPWACRRKIRLAELVDEPWTWPSAGSMMDSL